MKDKNNIVPILFIIFNRPDTTKKVFDHIRNIKPKQLFIAADGPRARHKDDVLNCAATRKIIHDIDWECELKTLFLTQNLGCGKAVSNAITWFFEQVEEGIILEDDCIPDESFFSFCQEMLERYRHNNSVMMISGTSFLFNRIERQESYFFAKYYPIWGWATWRRAWQHYNLELKDWDESKKRDWLQRSFKNKYVVEFWVQYFNRIVKKELDTWDVQWAYACISNQGLAIVPFNNLVSNIGYFGVHSNGQKSQYHEMPIKQIKGPIIHPAQVYDDWALNKKMYMNLQIIQQFSLKECLKKIPRSLLRKIRGIFF